MAVVYILGDLDSWGRRRKIETGGEFFARAIFLGNFLRGRVNNITAFSNILRER